MGYFSIYLEFHHPNWRTPSFFRGVGQPPIRTCGDLFEKKGLVIGGWVFRGWFSPISWGIPSGKHTKTMENNYFSWVNPLFQWSCSIAMLNYQRVSQSLGKSHSQHKGADTGFWTLWTRWPWATDVKKGGRTLLISPWKNTETMDMRIWASDMGFDHETIG